MIKLGCNAMMKTARQLPHPDKDDPLNWVDIEELVHLIYNLRLDIGEDDDRLDAEPAIAADLHNQLAAWRESVAAKIPAPNPTWEPPPAVA